MHANSHEPDSCLKLPLLNFSESFFRRENAVAVGREMHLEGNAPLFDSLPPAPLVGGWFRFTIEHFTGDQVAQFGEFTEDGDFRIGFRVAVGFHDERVVVVSEQRHLTGAVQPNGGSRSSRNS